MCSLVLPGWKWLRKKCTKTTLAVFKKTSSTQNPPKQHQLVLRKYLPRKLWLLRTDNEVKITNNYLPTDYFDNINVKHIVTHNEEIKVNYVEWVIKTLQSKLQRFIDKKENNKSMDVLQDAVSSYNNMLNLLIGMITHQYDAKRCGIFLWWSHTGHNIHKTRRNCINLTLFYSSVITKPKYSKESMMQSGWCKDRVIFTMIKSFLRDNLKPIDWLIWMKETF